MTFEEGILHLVREHHDLIPRQLAVLLLCNQEARTIRGLATLLNCETSGMVRVVDKLTRDVQPPLLSRKADPEDGRSVIISITPEGRLFISKYTQ